MAGSRSIALRGGLNMSPNRFDVSEGQMVECYNYEVTKDGVVSSTKGYRAYSGGCLFDSSFALSSTYALDYVHWGFGKFTTVGGDTFEYAGIGLGLLSFDASNYGIMGGVAGRLPLTGERINGATGAIDNYATATIATKASTAAAPMLTAHRMMTWEVAKGPNGANVFETTAFTGDSAQAEQMYCTSQIGYPPGCFYWKDRLHVVCDIPSFAFGSGASELVAGTTVYLYTAGSEDGPFTVERVIVEEGSWAGSDASGDIWLVGLIQESIIRVQDQGGAATPIEVRSAAGGGGTLYCTINTHLEPAAALLSKESGPYTYSPTASWTRVDLGYELRFNGGRAAFVVVNRLANDAAVGATPTLTATELTVPGTATSRYWTTPNNAKADDAAVTSATAGTSQMLNPITLTNFGFAIPTYSVITGIEVTIERQKTGAGTLTIHDAVIELVGLKGASENKANTAAWPGAFATMTYGGAADLWGAEVSPETVNDSDFGVRISVNRSVGGSLPGVAEIDVVKMRIHYKPYESTVYFYNPSSPTLTISSITRSSQVATATTSVAHGYVTGQTVTVSGATQAEYNINAVITVTGSTTFTYTVAGSPATPATGSPVCNLRDVATGSVVWYYKEKGVFDPAIRTAEGIATIYNITNPTYVTAGLNIYSGANATGTYYADTAGVAEKVYLPSSAQCQAEASQYEFEIGNFYGSTQFEQVFGVNGAGPAFSYDGKYAIRIRTGVENNIEKPRHVSKHGYQLALGYSHGDVAFSDVGAPESFAAVTGGASPVSTAPDFIGGAVVTSLADPIYALVSIAEQSLAVFCRNSVNRISGSAGTFTTQVVRAESGVVEYTVKDLGGLLLYTDFRGIGILQPSDIFGQLLPRYVSSAVSTWLTPRLQQSGNSYRTLSGPIRAETLKSQNQYRLYFRDRYVLTMTLVGQDFVPQFSMQQWNHDVRSSCSGVHSNGNDMAFFTTSGVLVNSSGSNYVYQSDVGTTFDGTYIPKRALFYLGTMGDAHSYKRFSNTDVHISAYGYANLGIVFGVDHELSGGFSASSAWPLICGSVSTTVTGATLDQQQNFVETVECDSRGFALLMQVEQFGGGDNWDYDAQAALTDHKYLMPHSLNSCSVFFEREANLQAGR